MRYVWSLGSSRYPRKRQYLMRWRLAFLPFLSIFSIGTRSSVPGTGSSWGGEINAALSVRLMGKLD